ncbi:MAG: hypothetical protein BGP11_12900 [Rhodobacterales bacterium 65-51]|nr:MAG: hypothetical protein BGP11_12900 [Rhodobacterales bacterium 65-51]
MSIDWSKTITAEAHAAAALAAAKAEARVTLAAAVTAARAALITDLPGQSIIYLAKEAEARAWMADPAPDLADYPLIAAEIGITAPDAASLVQIWLNMAALWRSAAADLEALRLTASAAIDAATTLEEVGAAVSQLVQVQG